MDPWLCLEEHVPECGREGNPRTVGNFSLVIYSEDDFEISLPLFSGRISFHVVPDFQFSKNPPFPGALSTAFTSFTCLTCGVFWVLCLVPGSFSLKIPSVSYNSNPTPLFSICPNISVFTKILFVLTWLIMNSFAFLPPVSLICKLYPVVVSEGKARGDFRVRIQASW